MEGRDFGWPTNRYSRNNVWRRYQSYQGAMSSKLAPDAVDAGVIRRYERESEELAKQVDDLSAQLKEAEEALEELNRQGPQLDMEMRKLELEMTTLQKRVTEALKRTEGLRSAWQIRQGELYLNYVADLIANLTQKTPAASESSIN